MYERNDCELSTHCVQENSDVNNLSFELSLKDISWYVL